MNVFDSGGLDLENPQSKEEDEELEDQRRRQEELNNLLTDAIPAFKYDDDPSTCSNPDDSSACESNNFTTDKFATSDVYLPDKMQSGLEQDYLDAGLGDHLKVLYEARVREVNKLKEELHILHEEKEQATNALKRKLTLSEADIRQLHLSVTNLESLLVEKAEIIKQFQESTVAKEIEIDKLQKCVEYLKVEACAYSSTISELQLKLANNNPFGAAARSFNSEELQKAHQEQILKLQNLLEEQSRKSEVLEKENAKLKLDLQKCIEHCEETEKENDFTVRELSVKLQNSQQQCRDLFTLGEALKKESDHFKERLTQVDAGRMDFSILSPRNKSLDKETLHINLEKLKKLLLDKDIAMNVLEAKLRFYDRDMSDLFEYRKLLSDVSKGKVKPCDNKEHIEQMMLLQGELQMCEQVVQERNRDIVTLNKINKELREKIEEMLEQTRNGIHSLSEKYSLPQLEMMHKDLEDARETIQSLQKQLREMKNEDLDKALAQIENLQRISQNEKCNFEEILDMLKKDLKRTEDEISKLKEENAKLRTDLNGVPEIQKESSKEYEQLREQLGQLLQNSSEKKAENELRETIEELTNAKAMLEGEKFTLEYQLQTFQRDLERANQEIANLRCISDELTELKKYIKELEEQLKADQKQKDEDHVNTAVLEETNSGNKEATLQAELSLREQLQKESMEKLRNIEERYKKALDNNRERYLEEINKMKTQEGNYRREMSNILAKCSEKMMELEEDNSNLKLQFKIFESQKNVWLGNYQKAVAQLKANSEETSKKTEAQLEYYKAGMTDLEKQCNKRLKNVLVKIKKYQNTVEKIEHDYNKKIDKCKKNL